MPPEGGIFACFDVSYQPAPVGLAEAVPKERKTSAMAYAKSIIGCGSAAPKPTRVTRTMKIRPMTAKMRAMILLIGEPFQNDGWVTHDGRSVSTLFWI